MPRCLAALAVTVLPLVAQAPEALLADADRHRHPWPSFRVEVRLGEGPGAQVWRVHARENGDARVEGLSEKEKGRSVLVLGDDMWLLLPDAKRPVKVSPRQRLMGPASGGDLARTRFREDYAPAGEATRVDFEGVPALRLELRARRASVTHAKAVLWIAAEGHRPLRADFSLASGKLARTVIFEPGTPVSGRAVIQAMRMTAPDGSAAMLRFSAWSPEPVDEARFTLPKAP